MGLPLFGQEVLLANEGVEGHVDHAAHGVTEHTSKGLQLLDDFGIVVTEQAVEHAACTQHQFIGGFKVPAGQEEGVLERVSLTPGEEQLELIAIKPKQHEAHAEGDVEIRVVLGELEHVRHGMQSKVG